MRKSDDAEECTLHSTSLYATPSLAFKPSLCYGRVFKLGKMWSALSPIRIWRDRFLVLENGQAAVFQDERSYRTSAGTRKSISLVNVCISKRDPRTFGAPPRKGTWIFCIFDRATSRDHVFSCYSEHERDLWIQRLERATCSPRAEPGRPLRVSDFSNRPPCGAQPNQFPTTNATDSDSRRSGGTHSEPQQEPVGERSGEVRRQSSDLFETDAGKMARFAERWKEEAFFWKEALWKACENEQRYQIQTGEPFDQMRA